MKWHAFDADGASFLEGSPVPVAFISPAREEKGVGIEREKQPGDVLGSEERALFTEAENPWNVPYLLPECSWSSVIVTLLPLGSPPKGPLGTGSFPPSAPYGSFQGSLLACQGPRLWL